VKSGHAWTVRAVLATAGLILASLCCPGPAYAEEPVALVEITLTSMNPALLTADGEVTLSGTVTNITDQPIVGAQAYLWRNQTPIVDREGIDRSLESESNDPIGARRIQTYQNLFTDAAPNLDPGQSAPFSLTARVADLGLQPPAGAGGIYLIGVHVLASGNPFAIGRARTFAPMIEEPPENALTTTTLVTLASRPSLVRTGVLSDDHLAAEVAPKGRLSRLLTAADNTSVSFAVDPALIEELQTMERGYAVLTGDGGTRPGAGQADAARWLEDFAEFEDDHDGYRLLYGSPDLAALVHDKQRSVAKSAAAANQLVAATRDLPLLIMPTAGMADAATVAAATELDPVAIVLSDTSAAGPGPLLTGLDEDAPIVSLSSTGPGGGPGPDPRDTAVQVRQRTLAETWVEASTADDGTAHGRVTLISSAAQAKAENADLDVPWIRDGTLADLLKATPAEWDQKYRYPESARDDELTVSQLGSLRRFAQSHRTFDDLLVEDDDAKASGDAAVARAGSGAWRKRNQKHQQFLRPQQGALDAVVLGGVEIRSNAKVSTVAQEGVVFPITIRNNLGASPNGSANVVKVRLIFTSDNRQRLTIKPIDVPPLQGQESFTANAEVTARANGIVPVTAQLQTESGAKVGRPFVIEVQVTQNGTTGWVIALAAGVVLVGTTALRIRTVSRERALADQRAAELSGGPSDVLSSAPPTDHPGMTDPGSSRAEQLAERDV